MRIQDSEAEEVTGGRDKKGKLTKISAKLYKTVSLAADIRRNVRRVCRE
jgi:hypothetical protein